MPQRTPIYMDGHPVGHTITTVTVGRPGRGRPSEPLPWVQQMGQAQAHKDWLERHGTDFKQSSNVEDTREFSNPTGNPELLRKREMEDSLQQNNINMKKAEQQYRQEVAKKEAAGEYNNQLSDALGKISVEHMIVEQQLDALARDKDPLGTYHKKHKEDM